MSVFLLVSCLVLLLTNVTTVFLLVRSVRRLFLFDELVQYLMDDVDTNLLFYGDMLKKDLFSNEPSVVEAHKKMNIIALRLEEFMIRLRETSGLEPRRMGQSKNPPHVV